MANVGKSKEVKKKTTTVLKADGHQRIKEIRRPLQQPPNEAEDHDRDEEVIKRLGGDGESLPHTPPNEAAEEPLNERLEAQPHRSPFSLEVTVDMMAVILFVIGLITRLHRLDQPKHVV